MRNARHGIFSTELGESRGLGAFGKGRFRRRYKREANRLQRRDAKAATAFEAAVADIHELRDCDGCWWCVAEVCSEHTEHERAVCVPCPEDA